MSEEEATSRIQQLNFPEVQEGNIATLGGYEFIYLGNAWVYTGNFTPVPHEEN